MDDTGLQNIDEDPPFQQELKYSASFVYQPPVLLHLTENKGLLRI